MPSYANNFELLTAIVTHLAMGKYPMHQPRWFANELHISDAQAITVLEEFKGLFRKSRARSEDHDEPFYSLHLRHARQDLGEDRKAREALELKDLMELLNFIARKANEETQRNTGLTVSMIAAGVAVAASVATVTVALTR